MNGQFSRLTARRARRYSSVRLQQGRVHLDADFNEQVDINAWRDRATTRDVIGPTGAPMRGGGFALSPVVSLTGLDGSGTSMLAVGARGTVLASADSGQTWTLQVVPAAVVEAELLAVDQFDASTAIAVTAVGEILFQSDGTTWTVQNPAASAGFALRGAQLLSPTSAWVVGANGLILGTTNGGAAWATRTAAGVTEALHAVHFPTATDGWAVGAADRIVHTADGGATWAPQVPPAGISAGLNAVRFASDALHGWAVGDGTRILATVDGGVTWVAQSVPAGVDSTLRGLDVVSSTVAWAVGDAGTVIMTQDGTNWSIIDPPKDRLNADLRAVRATSAIEATVAGDLSRLGKVVALGPFSWVSSPTLPGRDLAISAGRLYVDGLLVENDAVARYLNQPDLIGSTIPGAGTYRAYLDVWTRHLTALDRPELLEVALGGPDTATRTQTVWQVRIEPAALPTATTCTDAPALSTLGQASTGRLRARGAPAAISTGDCMVPAGGGYRRLENLLYRVEIQRAGAPGTATFKWSRDNGSITARLTATDPASTALTVTIADPGRAPGGDFSGATFVELTDDRRILAGESGELIEVLGVSGTTIRVKTAPPTMSTFGGGAIVRRWDGTGSVVAGGWQPLANTAAAVAKDGIEVEFGAGKYVIGDHWTIPARTLLGDVEWPRHDGVPTFLPRDGIEHRFAALAMVAVDAAGTVTVVEDCRTIFPSLGELETLVYVSGDGQEQPGGGSLTLPDAAVVGVTCGPIPVQNARVRFLLKDGGDIDGAAPEKTVFTGKDGLASVSWTLANADTPQHLTAERVNAAGARLGTPVEFQARIRGAASVSYEPGCTDLEGVTDVQTAIDTLCKRPSGKGGCCHSVGKTDDQQGEYPDLVTALKDLIQIRKHQHICLCLLPGDHELPPDDLTEILKGAEVQTLELGGKGARLRVSGRLIVDSFQRVTMRDLLVEDRDGRGLAFADDTSRPASNRLNVHLVDLVVRGGKGPREEALLEFKGCGRVRLTGCDLDVSPSDDVFPTAVLFVDAPPDARLVGNRIAGGISFGGIGRDLGSEVKAESAFRDNNPPVVPEGAGRLRLDGNSLDWFVLGAEASQALASTNGDVAAAKLESVVFAQMFVTNNTFRDAPHIFMATAVTLHGNMFELAGAGDSAPRLGFVAAAVASATGNLGPDVSAELVVGHGDDKTAAGNARLTII